MGNTPNIRFKGFTDDWEQRKFSELVTIERGGSPRPIDKFITKDENGLNWVKIGDAPEQGNYITKTAEKIKPEGLSKTREVHPGDLILSNSMSFGRPYIMAINGCIHDGWLLIRDTDKIFDLKFLCTLLGTDNMLNQYKAMAAGSTVNNLNKELVGGTTVAYPSMEEQTKLGGYFTKLDHLITLHQRKCDETKELKKFMLQKMFPKNGEKKPEIRFEGFTDDWEQRKVVDLITDIADGPFGSNLKTEHYTDEKEARIIQLSNLSDYGWQEENTRYTTFEHANEIKRCIVKKGELVMGKMMPAGMTIMRPNTEKMYVLSSDCVRIKLDNELIENEFFLYTTKSETFLNQVNNDSQGSTRVRTSISKIRNMNFSLPSLAEQIKIGDYFRNLDTLITLHQHKYEELQELKKFMLQNMFV